MPHEVLHIVHAQGRTYHFNSDGLGATELTDLFRKAGIAVRQCTYLLVCDEQSNPTPENTDHEHD